MSDRTKKSIKNAHVSLFYYFVQMILSFWTRKIFFDYLGSEVLGLDTTAQNLLGFLNLAELGVSSSVAYFLYKPLFDKDTLCINEIVSLQGWIYRRVAMVIIGCSCIFMTFFPLIFDNLHLPLWYAYATFSVMLCGSLLGYYINYKQIVLTADQNGYKVARVTKGASVFFNVLLIFLLPVVPNPFVFYLLVKLLGQLVGCLWLGRVLKKEYPWLQTTENNGKALLKKYPDVFRKTKQVFIHRISGTVLANISPLLMYSFSSLSIIAYYGNYLVITNKVASLLGVTFSSTGAGIGHLIASNNKKQILSVFWELFDSRLCISWICLFCIYFLSEPFIILWLGNTDYLLGKEILVLVVISSAVAINRTTIDSYISGYGLFQDVWAPVAESITNISLSFCFGYLWGIKGVVCGSIIAQAIFVGIWKPYFLFTQGIKTDALQYFKAFIKRCLLLISCFTILKYLYNITISQDIESYHTFAVNASIFFVESAIIVTSSFYIFTAGTKSFFHRVIGLVHVK